jgi:hypothetical protein
MPARSLAVGGLLVVTVVSPLFLLFDSKKIHYGLFNHVYEHVAMDKERG